jgi:SdrD B-like domain/Secretion system C-terminal sorting domain
MANFYNMKKRIPCLIILLISMCTAEIASAQISGTVFRDYNANGVKNNSAGINETFVQGITVKAFNAANVQVGATKTTDASGAYSFTSGEIPRGVQVRIEFSGLSTGDYPTFNGTGNGTNIQFVTAPSTTTNFAINYPDEYWNNSLSPDPRIITSGMVGGDPLLNATVGATASVKKFNYNKTSVVTQHNASAMGTIWGKAFNKKTNKMYYGAYIRSHAGLGPQGLGAIYYGDTTTGAALSSFIVPNVGTVATNAARGLTTKTAVNHDETVFDLIGKAGIGDIDIDQENQKLYAVNLTDKKVYVADLSLATPVATAIANYTSPGCTNGSFRPFALKIRKGKLYLGGVCSGETEPISTTKTNLYAYVLEYTISTGTWAASPVLSFQLNYAKELPYPTTGHNSGWYPWIDQATDINIAGLHTTNGEAFFSWPTPMLSDIEFADDGAMILGFIDRTAQQLGTRNWGPDVSNNLTRYYPVNGGDILRATGSGSSYTIENIGTTTASNEFFKGDAYLLVGGEEHRETAKGALAVLPGKQQVLTSGIDPGLVTNELDMAGLYWLSSANGAKNDGLNLFQDGASGGFPTGYFLKSNGMGDVEVLTGYQPIQIGNRIWLDADADGIQDANETVAGVPAGTTVTLTSPGLDGDYTTTGDNQTWTTTTDANGNYYFSTLSSADNRKPAAWAGIGNTVLPGYSYRVSVVLPGDKTVTTTDVSTNTLDAIDNDATLSGSLAVITFNTTNTNHNFDIGLKFPPAVTTAVNVGSCYDNNGNTAGGTSQVDVQVIVDWNLPALAENITVTVPGGGTQTFDPNTGTKPRILTFTVTTAASGNVTANYVTTTSVAAAAVPINIATPGCVQTPCANNGGVVFRDFNGNGTKDASETVGIGGVTVTATWDNAGTTGVATTTTDALGQYNFATGTGANQIPSGAKVRIEFTGLPANVLLTSNGTSNGTSVQFYTAPSCAINLGVNYNGDYCQTNPNVAVPMQYNGTATGNSTGAVVSFPYTNSGTTPPSTFLTTFNNVGSVWGQAYQGCKKRLFMSAFTKRHAGFGSQGEGGIYVIDQSSGSPVLSSFNLQGVTAANGTGVINLGTVTRTGGADFTLSTSTTANIDLDAFDKVGKTSFGDAELSDDCNTLWLTNLNQTALISVDVSGATLPGTVNQYLLTGLPNCGSGQFRIFGLRFHQGSLYVGGVCTGENGGAANGADNYAYVLKYNPANIAAGYSIVLNFRLNYNRESVGGGGPGQWQPWSNVWKAEFSSQNTRNAEPILSNIDFTAQGNMVIALMDRHANQMGYLNYPAISGYSGAANIEGMANGDILHACFKNGIWSIEGSTAACADSDPASFSGQSATDGPYGTGEYYYGDYYTNNVPPTPPNGLNHEEISIGSVAIVKGTGEVLNTVFDPIATNGFQTQGLHRYNTETGALINAYRLQNNSGNLSTFGKASGLGDIEALCNNQPIQIGNRIWIDSNGNGIQDPAETTPGVPTGTTVTLRSPGLDGIYGNGDDQTWTTTTDANGNYYFSALSTADNRNTAFGTTILPGLDYRVEVAVPTNYIVTKTDIGSNNDIDNDANQTGTTAYVSVNTSATNHSYDIGLFTGNTLGDKVWRDDNTNGTQDTGEPGVAGVTVTLYANGPDGNPGTTDDIIAGTTITDAYGNYLFTNLPDGNYNVKFTLPANYSFTTQNTPGDNQNNTNSDANPSTGRTGTINLSAGATGETDLTIDAGIIFTQPAALSSIGDKVWYDTNGDGIQDAGEAGVAGVTVTLYDDVTGNILAVTTTDATGKYIFNNLPNGNYQVGFTPLPGTILTQNNGGTTPGNATTNSDADPVWGRTGTITIAAAGTVITGIDAGLKDDPKASLGDYVWNDLNANGIQDAGEPGVPGVAMTLYFAGADGVPGGGDDVLIRRDTTDATGYYLFSNLDQNNYFVTATLPPGYSVTTKDAGTNDYKDSDFGTNVNYPGVQTSGIYNLLTGQNYLGVDMGIKTNTAGLGSIGDKVWMDTNANGLQDGTESGMAGITVSLLDGSGNPVNNPATGKPYVVVTDSVGNYKFVDLPAGSYQVKFTNLPAGTSFTSQDAAGTGAPGSGTDGATDSDVNPATGKTATITLGAGQNITTVDAGIIPSIPAGKGSLGNKVWIDADNDGIQDANEQGVPNVTVELYFDSNGDGVISGAEAATPFKTTLTDGQGNYLFTGLDAGAYQVKFVNTTFPSGYTLQAGKNNAGTNDATDSDPDPATGLTGTYILAQGEDNLTVDAGLYNTSATNSIGDKVWLDTNSDGKQDAGESGMPNITVNLIDATGAIIASTVTDANGNYYFGNLPNGNYAVQVAPPAGYSLTVQNGAAAGTTAVNNSDFSTSSFKTAVVSLTGGTNITDLDAGLVRTRAALGDKVWYDANGNGTQDGGAEVGIPGVTVTLYRPGFGLDGIAGNADDALPVASMITDANGNYLFANLIPGDYQVAFSTIPAGLEFTQQNTAGDNQINTNSDPVPSTGRTGTITLSAGETDLTVDAGLRPLQLGGVGDFVWYDANNNGIQDAGESAVPGVLVTLRDAGGNVVGTTVTNGNGNYLFTNLPAGSGYTITFTNLPAGAGFTNQTSGTTNGSDPNQATGITSSFTITAGQINRDIDAGIRNFSPLPSQKLVATVALSGNNAILKWITENEINTKRFYAERSQDNRTFTGIGDVAAAGNNQGTLTYSLRDDVSALTGVIYYRIKLADIDGKVTYSNVVAIRIANVNSVKVWPNPFTDKLSVSIYSASAEQVTTKVVNTLGQAVITKLDKLVKGNNQILIEGLNNLAKGTYTLQIISSTGNILAVREVQKQ